MHDLVIRGATIVDGSGAPAFSGDVVVDAGRITAVGRVDAEAREVIDATGLVVTPGFVDIHCHYDGQASWDELIEPSSLHGVTTVIIGNCGVGFAPAAPDRHDWLIRLMEGVEDIPGAALAEGITWGWESFPEYLDVLAGVPHAIDIGTQVPHGAVRAYVMGERGARNEPATPEDVERMAALVHEGLAAGAFGFSSNRLQLHRSVDGEPVPGTFADEAELFGITRALRETGIGTIECAPAKDEGAGLGSVAPGEWDLLRRLAEAAGRPVIFNVGQNHLAPTAWQDNLVFIERAVADGVGAFPQTHGRGFCMLLGWDTTFQPFIFCPSWGRRSDAEGFALGLLPLDERIERLREPRVRKQLLAEAQAIGDPSGGFLNYEMIFPMGGEPPNYEPPREESVAARARAEGRSELEVVYDLMLQHDGRELLMLQIVNYADYNLDAMREILEHPLTVVGGSDGGAHCGTVADASIPSFMLSYWTRDRASGRLPIELIIKKMTSATAAVYGLDDRGLLRPGKKADINVIDLDRLRLRLPAMVYDLPAGGRRLIQHADGYVATVVAGEVIRRDGNDTGARPGRLLRSGR